ncbi:hypothetical protein PYCC9005_005378 [Savitreella phatthalungensis]
MTPALVQELPQRCSPALNASSALPSFATLISAIRNCLGTAHGIDTSESHLLQLITSLEAYRSVEEEWRRYALGDPSRAYTRNLVDDVNGRANLLVLVWNPGKASPAHCHSNAHCLMKVLKGELEEVLYEWPEGTQPMHITPEHGVEEMHEDKVLHDETSETPHAMVIKRRTRYGRDKVAYISDALGVHRICNPSATETAVSLHLYTPPWTAQYGCQVFDEQSGRAHRVRQVGFYSVDGKRCT